MRIATVGIGAVVLLLYWASFTEIPKASGLKRETGIPMACRSYQVGGNWPDVTVAGRYYAITLVGPYVCRVVER